MQMVPALLSACRIAGFLLLCFRSCTAAELIDCVALISSYNLTKLLVRKICCTLTSEATSFKLINMCKNDSKMLADGGFSREIIAKCTKAVLSGQKVCGVFEWMTQPEDLLLVSES